MEAERLIERLIAVPDWQELLVLQHELRYEAETLNNLIRRYADEQDLARLRIIAKHLTLLHEELRETNALPACPSDTVTREMLQEP